MCSDSYVLRKRTHTLPPLTPLVNSVPPLTFRVRVQQKHQLMANIYIRMPVSRCQYYRNRDPEHPLSPSDPIRFSEYTDEHYTLRTSIYNKALTDKPDRRFFSQQEWKNMLRGKDPAGRELRFKRDPNEWLTYDEIALLMGEKPSDKSKLFDYLCIKLPTEVFCIDTIRPVTPTWCIDKYGYSTLFDLINNDFKRSVIEWALATFDYVTSNGRIILRGQSAMLERFLMRYGIDPTEDEKDSLRRVIDRWLHSERCNYSSAYHFDMRFKDPNERVIPIDSVEYV